MFDQRVIEVSADVIFKWRFSSKTAAKAAIRFRSPT